MKAGIFLLRKHGDTFRDLKGEATMGTRPWATETIGPAGRGSGWLWYINRRHTEEQRQQLATHVVTRAWHTRLTTLEGKGLSQQ